jgi:hypothetical protein
VHLRSSAFCAASGLKPGNEQKGVMPRDSITLADVREPTIEIVCESR